MFTPQFLHFAMLFSIVIGQQACVDISNTVYVPLKDQCLCSDQSLELFQTGMNGSKKVYDCLPKQMMYFNQTVVFPLPTFAYSQNFTIEGRYKLNDQSILFQVTSFLKISVSQVNQISNYVILTYEYNSSFVAEVLNFQTVSVQFDNVDINQWHFIQLQIKYSTLEATVTFGLTLDNQINNFLTAIKPWYNPQFTNFSISKVYAKEFVFYQGINLNYQYQYIKNSVNQIVRPNKFNIYKSYYDIIVYYPLDENNQANFLQDYSQYKNTVTIQQNYIIFEQSDFKFIYGQNSSNNYQLQDNEAQAYFVNNTLHEFFGVSLYPLQFNASIYYSNIQNSITNQQYYIDNYVFIPNNATFSFYVRKELYGSVEMSEQLIYNQKNVLNLYYMNDNTFQIRYTSQKSYVLTYQENIYNTNMNDSKWHNIYISCYKNFSNLNGSCDLYVDNNRCSLTLCQINSVITSCTTVNRFSVFYNIAGSAGKISQSSSFFPNSCNTNTSEDECTGFFSSWQISQFKIYDTNLSSADILVKTLYQPVGPAESYLYQFFIFQADAVTNSVYAFDLKQNKFYNQTLENPTYYQTSYPLVFCRQGRYLSFANNNQMICNDCMDNCLECSEASQCTTCNQNYTFNATSVACECSQIPSIQCVKFASDYSQIIIQFDMLISINTLAISFYQASILVNSPQYTNFSVNVALNQLILDLAPNFQIRTGDTLQLLSKSLINQYSCLIQKEYSEIIHKDDNIMISPLAVIEQLATAQKDQLQFSSQASQSGYYLQPQIINYYFEFFIENDYDNSVYKSNEDNNYLWLFERNLMQPATNYFINATVVNYLNISNSILYPYSFNCDEIDLVLLSATYISDYEQIKFIFDQKITLQIGAFQGGDYSSDSSTIVIDPSLKIVTVDLAENFSYVENGNITISNATLRSQNCDIGILTVQQTSNSLILSPFADFEIIQYPLNIAIQVIDFNSSYTLQKQLRYYLQVIQIDTNTEIYNDTNFSGLFFIDQVNLLVTNQNYNLIITYYNFLNASNSALLSFQNTCRTPIVTQASYSQDYSQIIINFDTEVHAQQSFQLSNNNASIFSIEEGVQSLILNLQKNFDVFLQDIILVQSLFTFCVVEQQVNINIQIPDTSQGPYPTAYIELIDQIDTYSLDASRSISGYDVQPDLLYSFTVINIEDDQTVFQILNVNTPTIQIDKQLNGNDANHFTIQYNFYYKVQITVQNFLQQTNSNFSILFSKCLCQIQSANFLDEYKLLQLNFDRQIELLNPQMQIDIEGVLSYQLSSDGLSMTFTLKPEHKLNQQIIFELPKGLLKTVIENCAIQDILQVYITDNNSKKSPSLVYSFDQICENNYSIRIDSSQSVSNYDIDPTLTFYYSVFNNNVLITEFFESIFNLNLEQLSLGNYSIEISVTNFLGQIDAYTIIYPYNCKLSFLINYDGFIIGNSFSRNQDIILSYIPTLESDGSLTDYQNDIQWSLINTTGDYFDLPIDQVKITTLKIQPLTVQGGSQFSFKSIFTLIQNGIQQCYGNPRFNIQTEKQPMFCSIQGGKSIEIPITSQIIIDGSQSQDPNYFYNQILQKNSIFMWSIIDQDPLQQNSSILTLPSGYLSVGNYTVQMQQTSPNMNCGETCDTCISTIQLNIVEQYQPQGLIIPLLSKNLLQFANNLPVMFKGEVYTKFPLSVRYYWTIKDYQFNSTQKYFKLNEGELPLGSFEVTFKVTDLLGSQSTTQTFEIIGPPHSGSFTVNPTSGVVQDTIFTFKADFWQDEEQNLPLRYDFYKDGKILLANSYVSSFQTILTGKGNSKLQVVIKNNKDAEQHSQILLVSLEMNSKINGQQLLENTIQDILNQEKNFYEELPNIQQFSQNLISITIDQSNQLIDQILNFYEVSNINPSNFEQVTEVFKNILQSQQRNNEQLQNPRILQILQLYKQCLLDTIQRSQIYFDKLSPNSQIQQEIQDRSIDNVAILIEQSSDIFMKEKKEVLDLLGESSLLFKIPSDPAQIIYTDSFVVYAQRKEGIDYRNLKLQIQNIQFPQQGIDFALDSEYATPMLIPDNYRDLILIQWNKTQNDSYLQLMSLSIFDPNTQQIVEINDLSDNITFTYQIDRILPVEGLSCISRQSPSDEWQNNCFLDNVLILENSMQVTCKCNHLTDFSIFASILIQSNISKLWYNFIMPDIVDLYMLFSWVFAQQYTFLFLFIILFYMAKKIDYKYYLSESYHLSHCQFDEIQQKFVNIGKGKTLQQRLSIQFEGQKIQKWDVAKLIFSNEAVKNSLQQELSYISWIFYPQKNFQSRTKYALLMIKVQSLFFIVFLQTISEIQGTIKGSLYSLLTILVFQIFITIIYKNIMLFKHNQVQENAMMQHKTYIFKNHVKNPNIIQQMQSEQNIQNIDYRVEKHKLKKFSSQWYLKPFKMISLLVNPKVEADILDDEENLHQDHIVKDFAKNQSIIDRSHINTLKNQDFQNEESIIQTQQVNFGDNNDVQDQYSMDDETYIEQEKEQKIVIKKHYKMIEQEFCIDLDQSQISINDIQIIEDSKDKISKQILKLENTELISDLQDFSFTIDQKRLVEKTAQINQTPKSQNNPAQQKYQENSKIQSQNSVLHEINIQFDQSPELQFDQDYNNVQIIEKNISEKPFQRRHTLSGKKMSLISKIRHFLNKQEKNMSYFFSSKEGKAWIFFIVYFLITHIFLIFFALHYNSQIQLLWLLYGLGNIVIGILFNQILLLNQLSFQFQLDSQSCQTSDLKRWDAGNNYCQQSVLPITYYCLLLTNMID